MGLNTNNSLIKLIIPIAKWGLALVFLFYGSRLDEPLMCNYRSSAAFFIVLISAVLIIWSYRSIRLKQPKGPVQWERGALIAVLVMTLAIVFYDAAMFQYKKQVVLSAPESLLHALGRHFIIGYRDEKEIERLLRKGAVGGVYITSRNVRGKSMAAVKKVIVSFQSIAARNKRPPLFIAADQEGGAVSRLSPTLPQLPPLAVIADRYRQAGRRSEVVKSYAMTKAKQLTSLGVNLNLSPVVDLKTEYSEGRRKGYTRLDQRAIATDIDCVTEVAKIYCATLLRHGIRPTLKHFPGLGSVAEDTHLSTGILERNKDDLEHNDWRPFRQISAETSPFIMLGHVILPAIDPEFPVSLSSAVITDILRKEWRIDTILITDDFNMKPIAGRSEGIGKSAVRALNAGVDLILLSYDGSQYYPAMYEVIKANREKRLNLSGLAQSRKRLDVYRPVMHPALSF